MDIYFVLFGILLLLGLLTSDDRFFETNYISYQKVGFIILSFILILLTGLRKVGVGVDDLNYQLLYETSRGGKLRKDPAFFLLANILPSIHLLFLTFAVISVLLKTSFLYKHTKYLGLALLLYFSSHYFLHDFVQIRAAVASGLLLWALYSAGEKKYLTFTAITALAIAFHLSAIIFIPLLFLYRKNTRFIYIILGITSLSIGIFHPPDVNALTVFFPEIIAKRLTLFFNEQGETANLLNPIALLQYIIAVLIFIFWDKIMCHSRYAVYLVKSYLVGIFSFMLLYNIPGIGFRLYELLIISQIPLLDIMITKLKPRAFMKAFPIVMSIVYFYYYVIKYSIVNEYNLFFL
ncbi:MAG: EpsG family protein [Bacteroidota bacterium]